jgi:hypothetical protein
MPKIRPPKCTITLQNDKYVIIRYTNNVGKVTFTVSTGLVATPDTLKAVVAENSAFVEKMESIILEMHQAAVPAKAIRQRIRDTFKFAAYVTE